MQKLQAKKQNLENNFEYPVRQKIRSFSYIQPTLYSSMKTHCECGICGHFTEDECIKNECKCCSNFHIRSGTKSSSNDSD